MSSRCLAAIPSLLLALGAPGQDAPAATAAAPALELVGVGRVWDQAPHSAFTSLLRAHGRYYLAFREGERHVHGADGTARVLVSDDGQEWRSLALLRHDGTDLRDPKLSQCPDGRLHLVLGGSVYRDRVLQRRDPLVAFSDPDGLRFGVPQPARIDAEVTTATDWLWRVTWHNDTAWGVVYQPDDGDWSARLLRSEDGVTWQHAGELPVTGRPGEVTIRFCGDGRMVALVRREAGSRHAAIGVSTAPYTEWAFAELPLRLGGPDLAVLDGDRLLAGGRVYGEQGNTTQLGLVTLDGGWQHLVTLPSGGDTSYPGILVEDDRVLVSYYSSHEGKAAIYLATLRWR